jgi:methionyl aminopeptidase
MSDCQVYNDSELDAVRKAGGILRECLAHTATHVQPGISTQELDAIAEEFIRKQGGEPAFKGYEGYPATLCTSVNDQVVHAIPGDRVLEDGDIISLDCGVTYGGMVTDACITVPVGTITPEERQFLSVTKDTLDRVLREVVRAGVRTGTISSFIEKSLRSAGYAPVKGLTGHGLGYHLHQFPDIPNIGKSNTGPALPAHTIVAIEPIASMGSDDFVQDEDRWTLRTDDGSLACHFEHTVIITNEGCEIIT